MGADTTMRRAPRSRGVPAPPRKPTRGVLSRLRLIWVTMYPASRMLITGAVLLAAAYGIVALIFVAPMRAGLMVYLWGLPLLAGVGLAIFARGEPSDQTTVHSPRLSDADFDALEDRVDRLGRASGSGNPRQSRRRAQRSMASPARNEQAFIDLVGEAIDELPPEFAHALDHVAVVVSDQGAVQRVNGRAQPLYGLYVGYAGRRSYTIGVPVTNALPDRIVIFRDTLVHDYGNDPKRLRAEVTRTLRHELAHHLGEDEKGVRALGL